jgi:hypothetical protein
MIGQRNMDKRNGVWRLGSRLPKIWLNIYKRNRAIGEDHTTEAIGSAMLYGIEYRPIKGDISNN